MSRTLGLLGAGLALSGCVYLNTLYNARTLHDAGDRARLAGYVSEARTAYTASLEKAARAFRADSLGRWSAPALVLVGQNHVRLGHPYEARRALEEALDRDVAEEVRRTARLYLGAALVQSGEYARATRILSESLQELRGADALGEAHLWRARALLATGHVEEGWWDLDRAMDADPRLVVPGQLERMAWAVRREDLPRAAEAAGRLLDVPAASIWSDSLSSLVAVVARTMGPGEAAVLLAPARAAPWAPGPRDTLLLQRTALLLNHGDTLAAETELGWVARGAGPGAVPARLTLARIRLHRVEAPDQLEGVRSVLLPASGDPRGLALLEDLRVLELLAGREADPFASSFAAAELARESLEAPRLARALFVRAAGVDDAGEWRGKAALAAVSLSGDPATSPPSAAMMAGLDDPYVAAAANRYLPSDTLAVLDAALQRRLDEASGWARDEARRRDVLIRSRASGS